MPLQIEQTAGRTIGVVTEGLSGKEGGEKEAGRACLDEVGNVFPKSKDAGDFSNEMLKWEQ